MAVKLSEHFTFKKLFKATYPSMLMMVFISLYSIVDGLFVSNFAGKTAFAAINLIMPITMGVGALGFMMGAGGNALVAKTLGEGNRERANEIFSEIVYFTMIMAAVVSLAIFFFIEPIAKGLGATPEMLPDCVLYGRILIGAEIAFMLQSLFHNFFIVAEKPLLGFLMTVLAGIINIILDALFIVGLKWGVMGAAVATILSQVVGATVPFFYFMRDNKSLLKLCKAKFKFRIILKACTNGSSELLSNVSASVVSIVYNIQLLKYIGENGVAAYGIIMYVTFVFTSIFLGYAIGAAPIVGYHYGAQNHVEIKNLLKRSVIINIFFGVVMTSLSVGLAGPLSAIFVGYDEELLELTVNALRICSISFIIMGLNIYFSSFFTALNNGLISAIISSLRTLVFQIGSVLVLPLLCGITGIWIAIIIAEFLALVLSIIFLIIYRKKYHY